MAVKLDAQLRAETGKGPARRLRQAGRIPGVVYSAKEPTHSISVDALLLNRVEQEAGLHSLIDLHVGEGEGDEGKVHRVLISEIVRDPVRGDLVHVDFHAVALDEEMQTVVEIVVEGEEARTDDGIVNVVLRELDISCLPTDIPESLSVDVAGLFIGDVVTVADVTVPEGVTLLNGPEEPVVTITPPEEIVEAAAEAEGDAEEADAEEAAEADGEEE